MEETFTGPDVLGSTQFERARRAGRYSAENKQWKDKMQRRSDLVHIGSSPLRVEAVKALAIVQDLALSLQKGVLAQLACQRFQQRGLACSHTRIFIGSPCLQQ